MTKKRKILMLFVVIVLLFALTSCSGRNTFDKPITIENARWHDYVLLFPVSWIMQLFASWFNNSFGMGIILTTILIRTLAWPIYAKTNDLSMKMAIMQPDIQRIQEKYANKQDRESQQRQAMEMQAVYKKHKFSPLGCFMPLLQMPIFIAVYQSVQRIWRPGGMWTDKVSNMNFLTIDLSSAGNLQAIFGQGGDWKGWILALIVLGTNLALNYLARKKPTYQKQTHTHKVTDQQSQQTEQTMKIMQYVMVIMMFTFALSSNSIALYWVIGNTYSIIQTLINRKISEKKFRELENQDLVVKYRE